MVKKLIMKSETNVNKLILRRLCGRYITLIRSSDEEEDDTDEDEFSSSVESSGALSVLNQRKSCSR